MKKNRKGNNVFTEKLKMKYYHCYIPVEKENIRRITKELKEKPKEVNLL